MSSDRAEGDPFPRSEAISGIGWELGGSMASRAVKFVVSIALARLLFPSDFGLLALAVICFGFTELFIQLGMVKALVQRPTLTDRHRSSAFWLTFSSSVILAVLVFLAARPLSLFFQEPRLRLVLMVMAVDLVVSGAHLVHRAVIRRSMRFNRRNQIQLTSVTAAGSTAVVLAALGAGVWSLVANYMLLTLFDCVGYWYLSGWSPHFYFGRREIRELWAVAGGVTGSHVLNFWVEKIDDLLIGRYEGSEVLGLYTRAYALMRLPAREFSSAISRVMMPAFSRIQEEREQFRRIYLKVTRIIGLVTVPAVAGLLLTARSFVVAVLGPHWEAAVPFVQVLCLEGLKQPVQSNLHLIFEATGSTWLQFRWRIFYAIALIGAICVGIFWGAWGVAVAFVIVNYLLWYPHVRIAGGLIDMTFLDYLSNLKGIAASVGCMSAVLILGDLWFLADLAPWVRFGSKVILGVLVYGACIHSFDIRPYREGRQFLRRRLAADPDGEPA